MTFSCCFESNGESERVLFKKISNRNNGEQLAVGERCSTRTTKGKTPLSSSGVRGGRLDEINYVKRELSAPVSRPTNITTIKPL